MDFEDYLNLQSHTFVQYYRCRPISILNKANVDEDGNWIIMPPSALDRLAGFDDIPSPMMFRIHNPFAAAATHCGVHEFVADEGFIHMPERLMARLGVEDNAVVLVASAALPKATFVKLRPHAAGFLEIAGHKELLEGNFRKFQCLTAGETIAVAEGGRRYYLDVVEARPADAVCAIDTDCEVEFAPALDYVAPPPPPPVASRAGGEREQQPQQQTPRFTGVAARMDGKKVELPAPAPVAMRRRGDEQPRKPAARFTGVAARMDGKPVELPPPAPSTAAAGAGAARAPKRKIREATSAAADGGGVSNAEADGGKKQEKRFTGTQYSLRAGLGAAAPRQASRGKPPGLPRLGALPGEAALFSVGKLAPKEP